MQVWVCGVVSVDTWEETAAGHKLCEQALPPQNKDVPARRDGKKAADSAPSRAAAFRLCAAAVPGTAAQDSACSAAVALLHHIHIYR